MEANLLGTKNTTVINLRTHTVNAIILTDSTQFEGDGKKTFELIT
jgi:hypothetical protein